MGKDLTEVRSPQRQLIPDAEDWERYELPFLRGIAYKAKMQPNYRFRDLLLRPTLFQPLRTDLFEVG